MLCAWHGCIWACGHTCLPRALHVDTTSDQPCDCKVESAGEPREICSGSYRSMYGSTCMCRKAAERGGAMLSQAPDSSNRRTLAGVSVLTRSSGGSAPGAEISGKGTLSTTSTLNSSVTGLLPAVFHVRAQECIVTPRCSPTWC